MHRKPDTTTPRKEGKTPPGDPNNKNVKPSAKLGPEKYPVGGSFHSQAHQALRPPGDHEQGLPAFSFPDRTMEASVIIKAQREVFLGNAMPAAVFLQSKVYIPQQ